MENQKAENQEFTMSFRLESIRDLDFHFVNLIALGINDFDEKKMLMNYSWKLDNPKNTNKIKMLVAVNLLYPTDDQKEPVVLVNYFNESTFDIANFRDVIKVVPGESAQMNDQILGTFLSISFSNLRGILFEKLARSDYKDIILPAVTQDFVKKLIQQFKDKATSGKE